MSTSGGRHLPNQCILWRLLFGWYSSGSSLETNQFIASFLWHVHQTIKHVLSQEYSMRMMINFFLPSPLIVLSHTSQQLVHLISRGRNIFPMLINYPIVGLWIHLGDVTIKLQLEWRIHSKNSKAYFLVRDLVTVIALFSFIHSFNWWLNYKCIVFHTLPWLDLSEDWLFS